MGHEGRQIEQSRRYTVEATTIRSVLLLFFLLDGEESHGHDDSWGKPFAQLFHLDRLI
jgi:hypothetical protein